MADSRLAEQSEGRLENAKCRPDVVAIRRDDSVLAAVVRPEQLVCTIEKVETHDQDPTSEPTNDPWTTFQDEWSELSDQLKDTYRKVASDGGPSEDEIKDAFGTLVGAWHQVAGSVSSALQDPEVRQRLKDAGSAFATAVGRTITELGAELKDPSDTADRADSEEEQP